MSEELEALERIKQSHFTAMSCLGMKDKETEQAMNIIETALKRLEVYDKCNYQTTIHKDVLQISKELKALEIIKKKEADIYGIKNSIDIYDYNAGIENEIDFENRLLTQEEFDLLKEVLL